MTDIIQIINNKIEKVSKRTGHNKRQKRIIINALNSIINTVKFSQ